MERISAKQLGVLSFFLSRSLFLLFVFSYFIKKVHQDFFLVVFLGTILGTLLLLFYQYLQNNMTKNIWETLEESYPKGIAYLLKVTIFLSIVFLSAFLLRHIISYIHYSIAPNINLFILTITFLFLCYKMAVNGIETICRSSEILLFLLLFFVGITLLGLFPMIDVKELKPFFLTSVPSLLENSILYAFFTVSPLVFLLNIPKPNIQEHKKYKRYLLRGYLSSNLMLFLFAFLSISILGINLTGIYRYPFTVLLKKVTFFKIIERLESVLSIHWIFDFVLLISILFLWLKDGCKNIKNRTKQKGFFLLSILLSGIISLYLPLSSSFLLFILFYLSILIPFILFIVIHRKT